MKPKLFHISEEANIQTFVPRTSKAIWNFQKYVWAISEDKFHHYLLPRNCPRICVPSIIYVSESWESAIRNCTLFRYEFDTTNFELIDQIAGYYVSKLTEIPISKVEIRDCLSELELLNVELIMTSTQQLIKIKEEVVKERTDFSIIRWSNIDAQ